MGRPGTVIVLDNVIRNGEVANDSASDPNVLGSRRLRAACSTSSRRSATALQTAGVEGYDGFAIVMLD